MAENIEDAGLIRGAARDVRELREGFESMVKLAATRGEQLRDLREREDTLRDLISVIRLEVEDGKVDFDGESIVKDFLAVLGGDDLHDLTAVSV
jgi:hypothetical protein